jgi:hypothetical protein
LVVIGPPIMSRWLCALALVTNETPRNAGNTSKGAIGAATAATSNAARRARTPRTCPARATAQASEDIDVKERMVKWSMEWFCMGVFITLIFSS